MVGTPGRSGGVRQGAGRPAGKPVVQRQIRVGQKFLHHLFAPDGRPVGLGQMAEIVEMTRTRIVIRLEDGDIIRLGY